MSLQNQAAYSELDFAAEDLSGGSGLVDAVVFFGPFEVEVAAFEVDERGASAEAEEVGGDAHRGSASAAGQGFGTAPFPGALAELVFGLLSDELYVDALGEEGVVFDFRTVSFNLEGVEIFFKEDHAVRVAHRDGGEFEFTISDLQSLLHCSFVGRSLHGNLATGEVWLAHIDPGGCGEAAVIRCDLHVQDAGAGLNWK